MRQASVLESHRRAPFVRPARANPSALLRIVASVAVTLLITSGAEAQDPRLPQVNVLGNRSDEASNLDAGKLPWLRKSQSYSELDREALDRWEPRRLEDLRA